MTPEIPTARIFLPLLEPSRYKGAWGGRGSGKSHFFAGLVVEKCLLKPGARILCVREVQKSLKESAKRLLEDKINEFGLGSQFECLETEIKTPGGGLISFTGMKDHTAESVKSYEGYDVVDEMLRGPDLPSKTVVVRANWSDNPWFPAELEDERQDCLRIKPEHYDHIWEGGYATVTEGAYFAAQLAAAKDRIGKVPADPLMEYRAFWDIGTRDATAIWIAQFIGREIRVLDYYEAVGQPLAAHLGWLRSKGYQDALCVLPHDGERADHLTADKFADHIESAGFKTQTVKNQGKGAAMKRVEAARRLFPSIWFNDTTTQAGRDALGWYHERRDEARNIGLGPEHDWASHGADAFGLMCVAYEQPATKPFEFNSAGGGSWLGN
jgi:phage terminase large subunit